MTTDKMDKVAAVARMEAQKSAIALGESQKTHSEKVQQLEQLIQFKNEYERTLNEKGSAGMGARQLQDYRLFLSRLNEAIAQQTQDIQGSQESLQVVREEWMSKNQRNQALDQLVENRHRERLRTLDRIEQKRADDNSMIRGSSREGS